MAERRLPHWQQPEPDLEDRAPTPGTRAAGADPRDDYGHAVDFPGQDCPSCREHIRREIEQETRW